MILPETEITGAMRVAERVLEAVRAEPFRAGERSRVITVSVGVAAFPEHGRSATELLQSADAALYAAKRGGRDRWRAAGPPHAIVPAVPPASDAGVPAARTTTLPDPDEVAAGTAAVRQAR